MSTRCWSFAASHLPKPPVLVPDLVLGLAQPRCLVGVAAVELSCECLDPALGELRDRTKLTRVTHVRGSRMHDVERSGDVHLRVSSIDECDARLRLRRCRSASRFSARCLLRWRTSQPKGGRNSMSQHQQRPNGRCDETKAGVHVSMCVDLLPLRARHLVPSRT